jgi:hypothetical protein
VIVFTPGSCSSTLHPSCVDGSQEAASSYTEGLWGTFFSGDDKTKHNFISCFWEESQVALVEKDVILSQHYGDLDLLVCRYFLTENGVVDVPALEKKTTHSPR